MKKLLAILFATIFASSVALAIGPPPPGYDEPPGYTDQTPGHAFMHAHLYCPYAIEAGPDIFVGDYFIGETSGLLGADYAIEFHIQGQTIDNSLYTLLQSYYQGFMDDEWESTQIRPNQTGPNYDQSESYTEFIDDNDDGGNTPPNGYYYYEQEFWYEVPIYQVDFMSQEVETSLPNGTGDVNLTTEWQYFNLNNPNDGWQVIPGQTLENGWRVGTYYATPCQGNPCDGKALIRVVPNILSSDGTVGPGPYTFQATATVTALFM